MSFRRDSELAEEGMVPDLLHVTPTRDDSMFDGVTEIRDTANCDRLIACVIFFAAVSMKTLPRSVAVHRDSICCRICQQIAQQVLHFDTWQMQQITEREKEIALTKFWAPAEPLRMHMHVMWDEILDSPQLDNYDNTQTEF